MDPNKATKINQLIAAAQQGNRWAEELVMEHYKGLVLQRARTYYILGADRDDVIQEGMIGLFKAIRSYDLQGPSTFATYAGVCVQRQILDAIKAAQRKKHLPLNQALSLEESGYPLDYFMEEGCERETLAQESAVEDWQTLMQEQLQTSWKTFLSDFECQVLEKLLEGVSPKEIAQILKREPRAVYNATDRIKRKLRQEVEKKRVLEEKE